MNSQIIPMVGLRMQYQALKNDIDKALNETLENTAFIMGPNVHALENEISDYLNIDHSVSCASGTDALHLALIALDIGPGDEVIAPSFTFAATAEAIRYVGATPIFIDINADTLNLDTSLLKQTITDKTRAIIAVHLFGLSADMDAIKDAIKGHDIHIVEDCAQSFGAHYKNNKTGTLGDVSCFSFFPSKNLGCYGDGGMVCTPHKDIAEKIKLLRNHGSPQRYEHTIIGYNSRLDEIQAAILRIKLRHIEQYNELRHTHANTYTNSLKPLGFITPNESPDSFHVYHQYTLQHPQRDEIIQALNDNHIAAAIYYPKGLHQQVAFTEGKKPIKLPVTEQVSHTCFSLPMFPELTQEQITRVIDACKHNLL